MEQISREELTRSVAGGVDQGSSPLRRRLSFQLVVGVVVVTALALGVLGGLEYFWLARERVASAGEMTEVFALILLQFLVLEAVLTVSLFLFLRYRLVRPIRVLQSFTERTARGEPGVDAPGAAVLGSAELVELAAAVVHMRDSIREKVVALSAEVEDHRRTGAALRDSEENLRTTLNSIGDGVIATDAGGRIVRMNPVAERLTGWPCSEAIGRKLSEVYCAVESQGRKPVMDPVDRVLVAGTAGRVPGAGYPLLMARDGREYQVADSGAPIRSATGEMLGGVLVFRDVTDESAAQEQLRQSQKLDAIGRLAGGIAHEFNNMLSGILGGAELLQADLPPGDGNRKHLGMIVESAGRAADLSNKLLAFARKQDFLMTPTDVHRAIADAVGLLESTIDKSVRIDVRLAPECCVVMGDQTQLQGVFLNLGINAWHAMPEGGVLSITTGLVDLEEGDCRGTAGELAPGRYVEVKVRDTGRGIAPELLPRVFDPFFATGANGRGAGLGLAAVYGTVRQHKGAIVVRSEVGRGTYFRVLLPATREAVLLPATGGVVVRGRGRILMVDDEVVIREIAVAMLSRCGYDVLDAENGRVAVDIYRKRFAEIDLVILDMVMPAMGGRECFRELKRICPDVRILFASGVAQEDDLSDLRAQGLAGLVRKPFRMAEFSRAVADALQGRACSSGEAPGIGGAAAEGTP